MIKDYYLLFADIWKLFRAYAGQMPLTEAAWDELILAADKFVTQHSTRRRLALQLATLLINEMEQLQREAAA